MFSLALASCTIFAAAPLTRCILFPIDVASLRPSRLQHTTCRSAAVPRAVALFPNPNSVYTTLHHRRHRRLSSRPHFAVKNVQLEKNIGKTVVCLPRHREPERERDGQNQLPARLPARPLSMSSIVFETVYYLPTYAC
jgi:hypothetical protein